MADPGHTMKTQCGPSTLQCSKEASIRTSPTTDKEPPIIYEVSRDSMSWLIAGLRTCQNMHVHVQYDIVIVTRPQLGCMRWMVKCTPIKVLHDPWPNFIICLPYDHPHPSRSQQYIKTLVARQQPTNNYAWSHRWKVWSSHAHASNVHKEIWCVSIHMHRH